MPDFKYWLVVEGSGSFSLGKDQPIWRGKNRITADQAEQLLAYKDAHPEVEWLTFSTEDPTPDEPEPSTEVFALRPVDFIHLTKTEEEASPSYTDEINEPAEDDPEVDRPEHYCEACEVEFRNDARLGRHSPSITETRTSNASPRCASRLPARRRSRRLRRASARHKPPTPTLSIPSRGSRWSFPHARTSGHPCPAISNPAGGRTAAGNRRQ